MILLLGADGYVGRAIAADLRTRGLPHAAPSHADLDASSKDAVARVIQDLKPTALINAIGFTGRPNIDGTEREKLRCLTANTLVPGVLAEVLADHNIPWGHVSSGCIYEGTRTDGSPFTENDPPNFAFSHPAAGWYSRTKAMAETLLADAPECLIWRMRIPFDQFDHERNYISKLMRYDRLLEVTNSISQRQEFAHAAVESLLRRLPGGIYNITNPGAIRTSEVAEAIRRHGLCQRKFTFFTDEAEFMAVPGRVKRASCVLSSKKLTDAGIPLREVHDALEWTLKNWACDARRSGAADG
ncbi:MAG TPA: sugar nucleotide-binding protein [Terrimicrobiaceae bacterium]|nr:sugar nucleotide-binding protein [Terrimicrobiaceae bacterium]